MIDPKPLKWRRASALQKACRRGQVDLAGKLAVDLQAASSPWYARHRLQIIALEDAYGIPEQSCQAVFDAYNPKADVQELAQRLASLPKCRIATDVLLTLGTDYMRALAEKFAGHPVPDIVRKLAATEDKSLEGFQPALVLAAQIVAQADGELIDEVPDPEPMIANLPSSAYDWHCQEGRRSFAYFCKACQPACEFFAKYPELDKLKALGTVLFEREGGLCNSLLISPLINEVRQHTLHHHGLPWGGLALQQYEELCKIVADNMPILHKARAKIVREIDALAADLASRESSQEPLL